MAVDIIGAGLRPLLLKRVVELGLGMPFPGGRTALVVIISALSSVAAQRSQDGMSPLKGALPGMVEGRTPEKKAAEWITAADFGALCNGTHDDTFPLKTAFSAISAHGGGTLALKGRSQCLITESLATPSNVGISLDDNVGFRIAEGKTLTINSPMRASAHRIFEGSGQVRFGHDSFSVGSDLPVEWFGAVGDWSSTTETGTDNSAAIQSAVDSVKSTASPGENRTSNVVVPIIVIGPRSYMFSKTLDFPDFQYVQIKGAGPNASFLVFRPAIPANGIQFRSTSVLRYGNGLRDLTIASASAHTDRLLSVSGQNAFFTSNVNFSAVPVGSVGNLLYLEGMQTSRIEFSRFFGSGGSADKDAIVIAGGKSPVSTTVTFDNIDVEGSGGACINAGGSSSAASIVVMNSTLENCKWGIKAATNIVLIGNHFEHANTCSIFAPPGSGTTIQSQGNNFQQCAAVPESTFFILNGSTVMYSNNDVNDLAQGCTLYSAPTGSRVFTNGPQLPPFTFPEGSINSGDRTAIAAGVLARRSYSMPNTSGAVTLQLFRGNRYEIFAAAPTSIHVEGGSTLGAVAVNLPAGEEINLFLLAAGPSTTVSMADANKGDIPIVGQISNSGIAAGTYQEITLRMNASGSLVVASSPGWRAMH